MRFARNATGLFAALVATTLIASSAHAGKEPVAAAAATAAGLQMRHAGAEPVAAADALAVDHLQASALPPAMQEKLAKGAPFVYAIVALDKHGHVKWTEKVHNLVTTQGGNDLLDKYFKGSAYTASWFLGLAGTGTKALADTLASHAAWSEVTPYSGNRPAITFGTTASKSNTATVVSYSINATSTVAGAFVANVNTGTSGILYSVSDFAASRSVVSGDTLNVTLTVSD